DNTGLRSLAAVRFSAVVASFDKPLLIVDDTRKPPDTFNADGSLGTPASVWPSAAELDTFLYAVGGVPWRRAPAGTLSPKGVLAGFEFDTIGTRTAQLDGALPLTTLAAYRHVVWLVDFESARNSDPATLLSYATTQGNANNLGAYLQLGGEVWMVG